MMDRKNLPGRRAARVFAVLGALAGLAVLGIALAGLDYYLADIEGRPYRDEHADLRPSGNLGLVLAVAGTAAMFLNLSYLVRKRLAAFPRLGALRTWMDFHVLTGLVAPALIVLHSALAPRSPLAVLSLAALLAVVATGIVGRFIYSRVPRSLDGRELETGEVRDRLEALRAEMERPGPGEEDAGTGRRTPAAVLDAPSIRASPIGLGRASRRLWKEKRRLERHSELLSLMRSWRFFHRWLALLMLVLALFHIFVVWRFGDLWILGGGR